MKRRGRIRLSAILLSLFMVCTMITPAAFAEDNGGQGGEQPPAVENENQDITETTPEVTPEATPEPTPEVTPEPTPEATPEPTPEATPEPTPEATPEQTPTATPEPTPATFTITLQNKEGGALSFEPDFKANEVKAGTQVRVKLTLLDGYKLKKLTVKQAGSNVETALVQTETPNVYSFTMPVGNVDVVPEYEKVEGKGIPENAKAAETDVDEEDSDGVNPDTEEGSISEMENKQAEELETATPAPLAVPARKENRGILKASLQENEARDKAVVRVDFGSEHTKFVDTLKNEGYETDDASCVLVPVKPNTDSSAPNAGKDAYEAANAFVQNLGSRSDPDSGDILMNDLSSGCFVGFNPRSKYADENELVSAMASIPDEANHFYALWREPVDTIEITVTPPECGTPLNEEYEPKPDIAIGNDNCEIEGSTWNKSLINPDEVLKGDKPFPADCGLSAKWGYYFPDDASKITVTVNGGSLDENGIEVDSDAEVLLHLHVPVKHTGKAPVEENRNDADCENAGSYDEVVYCKGCEKELSRNTIEIPALGHQWKVDPNPVWAADYTTVTATATCTRNSKHKLGPIPLKTTSNVTKEATCTEAGETTYTPEPFPEDSSLKVEPKTVANIPALGHRWKVNYNWAKDYSRVTASAVCNNDSTHKLPPETVETTSKITKEPTCTKDGETTYTPKDYTNKIYKDGAKPKSVTVPALGHAWGEPTYEWLESNTKVKATRTCSRCGESETETVGTEDPVISPTPSPTTKGIKTYKSKPFTNPAFTVQTKQVALVMYSCNEGGGKTWTKGSKVTKDFIFKRNFNDNETFGKFQSIQVDGKTLAASSYKAEAGSLKVYLQPAYLETLSAGTHTLEVRFSDGRASTRFGVVAQTANKNAAGTSGKATTTTGGSAVRTGDTSHMVLWLVLMIVAAAGCGIGVYLKKRSK